MYELSIEQFTRYVANLVETLGNTTLNNPDSEETFPIYVVSNPMQNIKKTENNLPIYSRFSITVENWNNSKYEAMKLHQKTYELLRKYNFSLTGSPIDLYDEITKKYRFGSRYEVNYNGLTNSFERII